MKILDTNGFELIEVDEKFDLNNELTFEIFYDRDDCFISFYLEVEDVERLSNHLNKVLKNIKKKQ